jgi:hypothetical protein
VKPDDRSVILSRRALYLGSTLAVLSSCARSGGEPREPEAPSTNVVVPNVDEEDAGEVATADAEPPQRSDDPKRRPGMPSLEIPSGVNDVARGNYERLATQVTEAHDLIDQIENGLPSCAVTDQSCEITWRRIAEKRDLLGERRFSFSHVCKGSSADAKAFEAREAEHRTFILQRLAALDKLLADTVASAGKAGTLEWERIQADVRRDKPRVCLSFACVDW